MDHPKLLTTSRSEKSKRYLYKRGTTKPYQKQIGDYGAKYQVPKTSLSIREDRNMRTILAEVMGSMYKETNVGLFVCTLISSHNQSYPPDIALRRTNMEPYSRIGLKDRSTEEVSIF